MGKLIPVIADSRYDIIVRANYILQGLFGGGQGVLLPPPPLGFSLPPLRIFSTSNYVVCT